MESRLANGVEACQASTRDLRGSLPLRTTLALSHGRTGCASNTAAFIEITDDSEAMAEKATNVRQRHCEADQLDEPCDYVIHPKDNFSEDELSKTSSAIREIAGRDRKIEPVMAASTRKRPRHLMFWLSPLTERQADEVRKLAGVCRDYPCISVVAFLTVAQIDEVNKDGIDPDIEHPKPMKGRS